ncbi:hypothetical protein HUU62_09910 [Rhodoferax sp. 4810]|nr:hypothetical protein [Rhodoferax jenense]
MSSSTDTAIQRKAALQTAVPDVALVREAGMPFQPAVNSDFNIDPIAEWLSLMEVVEMLCPAWPARVKPMQGNVWRL